jgi:hypothetical protein
MTMQVGMIGSNGIVLASDTRWQRSLVRREMGTWHTSGGYKINISGNKKIVTSCAQDMCEAGRIASELLIALDGVDIHAREQTLRDIALTIPNNLAVECLLLSSILSLRYFSFSIPRTQPTLLSKSC